MNLEKLKNIILEYKDKLIITGKTPWQFDSNQKILSDLNIKYNNIFLNVNELIFLLNNLNNLENLHIFCNCGNKNNFINYGKGYSKHCSYNCSANDKMVRNKFKNTMFIKYGVDSAMKSDTIKQKYKNNYIKKYGIDNPRKNIDIINKIKKKMLQKDNNGKTKYEIIIAKREKTCFKKYGVKNYFETQEFKNKYKNEEYVKAIVIKRYNSQIKNNSFNNRSKTEIRCYEKLKTICPDALHSYKKDLRYPFNCDMYIPSKDLFIECHFYWTHGPYINNCHKPFNPNNKIHRNIIAKWKNKNTKNYDNAIKVWTERDPLKLKTFKDNNLNYKIFYTEKEFNDWFNKL